MQVQESPIDLKQVSAQALFSAQAEELERARRAEDSPGRAVETYFATMLVKELRRSLPNGFFEGAGADVYTSWLDQHLGRTLAERDTLGMARLVDSTIAREAAARPGGEWE